MFLQFFDGCDERAVRGEVMNGTKAGRHWKKEKDKAKHWYRLGPRLGSSRLVGSDSLGKCSRCLPARSEIESARGTRSTNKQPVEGTVLVLVLVPYRLPWIMVSSHENRDHLAGSPPGRIPVIDFANFIRGYLCRKSLSKSTTVSSPAQRSPALEKGQRSSRHGKISTLDPIISFSAFC